jgi:hypothetical protein
MTSLDIAMIVIIAAVGIIGVGWLIYETRK